jgi:adenine-specific DNA-methyltransferase
MIERGEIIFGADERTQPRQKVFLTEQSRRQVSSVIQDARKGKADLSPLGLDFPYCHPTSLYGQLVGAAAQLPGDIVLDYFAGSGTTAHAIINLNREDAAQRRFVLVEIGNYFDTILLPRLKKVTFTPAWKDGKPMRQAAKEEAERSPRIVKYSSLEGYEDALNNIEFSQKAGQKALKFDDYVLSYMLDWETKESETFLNVEKLAAPFSYKLRVTEDGQAKEKPVDLPETFNYLLGLHVKTRRVYHDEKRRYLVYRGTANDREVAVIWRETLRWAKRDFERDRDFAAENRLVEGADEVFVNGDSLIPKAKSLDPVFKRRMFGGE